MSWPPPVPSPCPSAWGPRGTSSAKYLPAGLFRTFPGPPRPPRRGPPGRSGGYCPPSRPTAAHIAAGRVVPDRWLPASDRLETPPPGATAPRVVKEGEHDWTLTLKAGDLTFSIIVVGKAEG